jgi:hypothetical protein
MKLKAKGDPVIRTDLVCSIIKGANDKCIFLAISFCGQIPIRYLYGKECEFSEEDKSQLDADYAAVVEVIERKEEA